MKHIQGNVIDFTQNGKCSGCGECCTATLPMSKKELKLIKNYVKRNKVNTHTHIEAILGNVVDLTCPFRNNDKKICEIYPVRPWICRKFICRFPHLANLSTNKKILKIINLRKYFGNQCYDKYSKVADSIILARINGDFNE